MNELDIHKIKEALQKTKKICIVFHFNPDGDALGSALALYHYFKEDGYDVSVVSPNPFPDFLNWMEGSDQVIVAQEHLVKARKAIKEADMLYVVDMNAPHRAGQDLQNSIIRNKGFKVLIDHHVQPEIDCDVMYSTHLTSSASELVFNFLYRYLTPGRPIVKAIAEALYVGIITDTGSMSYSCDTPSTYDALGQLIAVGINGEQIHQKVYSNYTESRLRLMAVALSHLKIMPEYGASYMYLTKQELIDNNFQIGDTEGFVNYGMTIKGIDFTAFFIERDTRIRVSFRSKGRVDVNLFARDNYNGGGHHNAAGAFYHGPIEEAIAHFEKTVREGKY
ncbi:MAG: DHH family phosphoesterase [Bacteroidales bacterium]|nr:DHH family phosphoesterase [Bacteroidales bacterium]